MGMAMTRRLWPLAAALVLSGCNYNQLVALQESIASSWAQVENQLQRRNDLIPNLVEVTKGYAGHEKSVFEAVADARARMLSAGSREEKIGAADAMTGALGRLLALSESYPNLKADAQFARLSDELAGTENRISVERMRFNDAVKAYNTAIKTFPTMLYASAMGFKEEKYFDAPEGVKQVPKVDFGTKPTP